METIGIRELKTNLSRHLKRVRTGVRLVVTERGRSIATIAPVEVSANVDWAHQMVAEGRARWEGGKPAGIVRAPSAKGNRATAIVIEDRR